MINSNTSNNITSSIDSLKLKQPIYKADSNDCVEQLIILGNGFDLACGLKSSYSDFFEYILKNGNYYNYWYNIFRSIKYNNPTNWTDIELRILVELQNIEFLYSNSIFTDSRYPQEYSELKQEICDKLESSSKNPQLDWQPIVRTANTLVKRAHYFIAPITLAQQYLKDDLLQLENDFKTFLKEQIEYENTMKNSTFKTTSKEDSTFSNYFIKSSCLLSYITKHALSNEFTQLFEVINKIPQMNSFDQLLSELGDMDSFYNNQSNEIIQNNILSFNYTQPVENTRIRNVHGSLISDNIIFGIDYDKLIGHFIQPPVKFSKSYRILENTNNSTLSITSKIDTIKFYGHGLGSADYSYFQAIFDTVDLYHSNTILVFYWSAYNRDQEDLIRKDYIMRVANLIEEYGKTFTNKDHGRNLLTKLQIENRLHIEEIPIDLLFNSLN